MQRHSYHTVPASSSSHERQNRCVRVSEVVRATTPPAAVSPDEVHLPGIYVHRLILGKNYEKRIEKRTTSAGTDAAASIAGAARCPHASHGAQL